MAARTARRRPLLACVLAVRRAARAPHACTQLRAVCEAARGVPAAAQLIAPTRRRRPSACWRCPRAPQRTGCRMPGPDARCSKQVWLRRRRAPRRCAHARCGACDHIRALLPVLHCPLAALPSPSARWRCVAHTACCAWRRRAGLRDCQEQHGGHSAQCGGARDGLRRRILDRAQDGAGGARARGAAGGQGGARALLQASQRSAEPCVRCACARPGACRRSWR
jgi:hypothetical protein